MSETVNVNIGSDVVSVVIEGGALGPSASINLQALDEAVRSAESSASSAHTDAERAVNASVVAVEARDIATVKADIAVIAAGEAEAARDGAQVEASKIAAVRTDAFTPNLWPDPELASSDGVMIWNRQTPNGAAFAMPVSVKKGSKAFATPTVALATLFFGPVAPISLFPSGRASFGIVIREKLGDQGVTAGANNIRIRLAALNAAGAVISTANWPVEGNDRPQEAASYYTRVVPRTDIVKPTTLIIAENLDLSSPISAGAVSIVVNLRIETDTVQAYLSHGLIRDAADPTYKPTAAFVASPDEAAAGVSNNVFMSPSTVKSARNAVSSWAAFYNNFPDPLFADYGATWGSAQGWTSSSGAMVLKGSMKTLEIPPTVVARAAQSPLVDVSSYKSGLFSASIIINEKLGDQGPGTGGKLRLRLAAYDANGVIITGAWAGYAGNEDPTASGPTYYTKIVPREDISRPMTLRIAEGLPVPTGAASIAVNVRFEGEIGSQTPSPAMYLSHFCIREGGDATWNMPPAANVGQGYLTLYLSPTGSDDAKGGIYSPLATADKALEKNDGVGEIVYLPGAWSLANARINDRLVRDLVATGVEDATFGRPLVRGGSKLAGVTKTPGWTKVYEAAITLTEGAPNFIWQDGVNDESTLVPATERHAFLRGRSYRLPCVRIVHVQSREAADTAAALALIDASPVPRCYYDATVGKLYFAIQGGGDARAANVYLAAADGLIYGGPHFWQPSGRLRMAGLHTRYAGINLRGFRRSDLHDCSVLGAYENCFDVGWRAGLTDCEGMGSGSGPGVNGDNFNAHNYAVWSHENCYGHDGWDDGWSSHENCVEVGVGSLAEYNAGSGFIPAYGAQAVGHHLVSRKNAVSPYRPGWKVGGFSAFQNTAVTDGGDYTSFEVYGCRSYGDRVGFYDSSTGGGHQAFLKAYDCVARDSTLYGYQCSGIEDCRYGGTGTALAPGVTAIKSEMLG